MKCPLCSTPDAPEFFEDSRRRYYRCSNCQLVFVPPAFYLGAEAEKAEYDLHRNLPDDPGYRRFLSRLFDPMRERLRPGSTGLDFGSGPGPTLSVMFEEAGFPMRIFDAFYAPDVSVWGQSYDFITATEVIEHLHRPDRDLQRLWSCLRPGGLLGIMTKLVIDRDAFSRWHYKNDPTHVCFFSKATFEWIAQRWGAALTFHAKDVILLDKPDAVSVEPDENTNLSYE